ncbi:MAG TPA: hypothetical protein VLV31_12020 [Candidatus Acidoferrales bacterium]|nr:hypothetical protein [Candidatus Acidoferrales bacterium]
MPTRNEEKMLPVLRASLARRLVRMGFKVNQIAHVLNVTPPAVTQYLKGVRGTEMREIEGQKQMIDALAEKAARRIGGDMNPLSTVELLDVAHQIIAVNSGEGILRSYYASGEKSKSIALLRDRLQLELKASQQCFSLANTAKGDYTRLLLRMIASDSIRHADIISQIIAFLETGIENPDEGLDQELLSDILALEDSADEVPLRSKVKVGHGVARLLLESIDMDEKKHDKLLGKMQSLSEDAKA